MNEATPRWRAFSSEAQSADDAGATKTAARRSGEWWLPLVAGLGGLGVGVLVVGALVFAAGALTSDADTALVDPPALMPGLVLSAPDPDPAQIVVDVSGAVERPGLHRLHAGDRVGDAIEVAGGFAPRADLWAASQALNLAQPLEDGSKVLVPELGVDRPTASIREAGPGRIDLNRASQTELESLPGIGPVTAGKIIDARDIERFGNVRELRTRGLVGESVFEDIEDLVRAS